MQRKLLSTALGLSLLFLIFQSNSSGAGAVQGLDRTGSPLSPGTCATAGCHTAGAFNPTLTIELLDNGTPVSQYEPGESYEMVATISAGTGSPEVYGLQAVALTGMDNVNAGFFEAPNGMQITVLNGRDYLEHSTPSQSNMFSAEWTAPPAGTGEVRFYASANAANGNGISTGDGIATLQVTVPEISTSVRQTADLPFDLSVFPNPAAGTANLTVQSKKNTPAALQIFDLSGRLLEQHTLSLATGSNRLPIDISRLTPGLYSLVLTDGQAPTATLLKVR